MSQPILPARFSPSAKTGIQPEPFAVPSEAVETTPATPPSLSTPQAAPPRTTPTGDDPGATAHEADSPRRKSLGHDVTLAEMDASLPRERTLRPEAIDAASSTLPQPELPPQTLRVPRESASATIPNLPPQPAPSRPQAVTAQVIVRGAPEASRQDPFHHVAEQSASNSLHSDSEPAAPVVRVTIGRVEVRAQFPAAPSPQAPRRSRALSLSLEDYLTQRSGGKR